MELSTAQQIVATLASGVHPVTGDDMPADSPFNQPPVIRALFTVTLALDKEAKRAGGHRRRSYSSIVNIEAVDESHARSMIDEFANRAQGASDEGEFTYCGVRGSVCFDMHSFKEHHR
jgi:hypothetical protein